MPPNLSRNATLFSLFYSIPHLLLFVKSKPAEREKSVDISLNIWDNGPSNTTEGSPPLCMAIHFAACFRGMFADTASISKASSTFKSLERSTQRSMEQLVKKLAHLKV